MSPVLPLLRRRHHFLCRDCDWSDVFRYSDIGRAIALNHGLAYGHLVDELFV